MNRRDIITKIAIIGAGLDSGLHRRITEIDSNIGLVTIDKIQKPDPILIKNCGIDYLTVYNSASSYKRGSNFTPKKKKRKKR